MYIYHERACQEIHNTNFFDMVNQCLWFFFIIEISDPEQNIIFILKMGVKKAWQSS